MTYTYFTQNLAYIAAVTDMLNKADLPDDKSHYIEVRLMSEDHKVVGTWSDEIAADDWYYSEADNPGLEA